MKQAKEKLSVGFLFDDTLDSSGGVPQYIKTLGAWLSSRGHNVSYLVGETKIKSWAGGPVYSLSRNQKVIFNGNHLSVPWPANSQKIKRVVAERNFDILHVQMPHSPFLAQKVINRASAGTAVVGTFHIFPSGRLPRIGARVLKLLYGRGLKKIDQVISVSQPAASFASQSFGLKTIISSNLVDVETLQRPVNGVLPQAGHIVFVGRLVKRKGVLELLKAFVILSQNFPQARLTIAGDGPQLNKLRDFAKRHNLDGAKVKFLGFVDERQKQKLLASAEVACFPSLYGESFGIVLIEAMAAGSKVVLGGKNPGYESVLGEQPELLINPAKTTAFAARLARLMNDNLLQEHLSSWQSQAVKKYDVNQVGQQIEDIYYQMIAKRRSKRHN